MAEVEVDASEVLLLIQQFLKEQGLEKSLHALQTESKTSLNAVESLEDFKQDILKGNWQQVFSQTIHMKLMPNVMFEFHQQVALELLESGECYAAKMVIEQPVPLAQLKAEEPGKFLQLDSLIARAAALWDNQRRCLATDVIYGKVSKTQRRDHVAALLCDKVEELQKRKLLRLLEQALKWQQFQGELPVTSVDTMDGEPSSKKVSTLLESSVPSAKKLKLMTGEMVSKSETNELEVSLPTNLKKRIPFAKEARAECAAYSFDGRSLVTGSSDGVIEIWNAHTCKLRKDLPYQVGTQSIPLMHSKPVISVCFSPDGEMIASGCTSGTVRVWRMSSGKCVRKFSKVHVGGIAALCFSPDSSQVASAGGSDCTITVHGLHSGRVLKTFRGHESFVNQIKFCSAGVGEGNVLVSGGSDGTARVWDLKTMECRFSYQVPAEANGSSVQAVCVIPNSPTCDVAIFSNSRTVEVISVAECLRLRTPKRKQELSVPSYMLSKKLTRFIGGGVSPNGRFLLAVGDDHKMYQFDLHGSKEGSEIWRVVEMATTSPCSSVAWNEKTAYLAVLSSGLGDPIEVYGSE